MINVKQLCTCIVRLSVLFLFTSYEAFSQNSATGTLKAEILSSYTGKYALTRSWILEFSKNGNSLQLIFPGQAPLSLIPKTETLFYVKGDEKATFEFVSGIDGFVKKVILTQGKEVKEARKLGLNPHFNVNQKFPVEQLKEDIAFTLRTLERYHPLLYDFVSKKGLHSYFDSLKSAIEKPMDEIEFRYLLMPAIAEIHDGHTSLGPSFQLQQVKPGLLQPFILYYEGKRAFVRYTSLPDLPIGTEVLSINGESVEKKINDLLKRATGDGFHQSAQYFRINQPLSWFDYEAPKWLNVKSYKLSVVGSNKKKKVVTVNAVSEDEFRRLMPPTRRQDELVLAKDSKTAILKYPFFDFRDITTRDSFLNATFDKLKAEKIRNLIIDLRGNGGGAPDNAASFLRYLMPRNFVYARKYAFPQLEYLSRPISPAINRFSGTVIFLIDGGCFSSTSHLLALAKSYALGKFVGETSSGSYIGTTDGEPHFLPNTDLSLNCPHGVFEAAVITAMKRDTGIVPDFTVKNTFKDLLEGKDRVLEFALKLVE